MVADRRELLPHRLPAEASSLNTGPTVVSFSHLDTKRWQNGVQIEKIPKFPFKTGGLTFFLTMKCEQRKTPGATSKASEMLFVAHVYGFCVVDVFVLQVILSADCNSSTLVVLLARH